MEDEWSRLHARPPPAVVAAATAAMSLVLGDDDLLREILLRLGLATSLLRAALVCKRWLRHASDPAFLRGFRARHPPGLLGAYLSTAGGTPRPRFLPVRPLPRELAAAARRAGSFFDGAFRGSPAAVRDCRGGGLLVTTLETHYGDTDFTHHVCGPLSPAGDTVVVPPPDPPLPGKVTIPGDCIIYHYHEFLPDGGGNGRSYSCVLMGYGSWQTTVHLYELQDMRWVLRSSAAAQHSLSPPISKVMLVDKDIFYMLSTINKILVCDFPSSSMSAMELPNGVEEGHTGRIMLARGDNSGGIYLVHVEGSQLRIFLSDNAGNWLLTDTVDLRQVCSNLVTAAWPSSMEEQSTGVKIHAVGDNASFVFLELFGAIVFLDIPSKQAEKMYELTPEDNKELVSVLPLKLMWPPVFPILNERSMVVSKLDFGKILESEINHLELIPFPVPHCKEKKMSR